MMRLRYSLLCLSLLAMTPQAFTQPDRSAPSTSAPSEAASALPDAPQAQPAPAVQPQPSPFLLLGPNRRIVAPGQAAAPAGPRTAFLLATQSSFSPSSILLLGTTTLLSEARDSHPDLGKGVNGYQNYLWRRFLDRTDGNYWSLFLLPTLLHQDERYYIQGSGGLRRRSAYAVSRLFVTRNYSGQPTVNASELLGRGIAQGIATTYYPNPDRSAPALASSYGYSLLTDAAVNLYREFWPDVKSYLRRRRR